MGIDRVLHEAHELAFQIQLERAASKPEKDLVQVEHDLDLLKRLADLQATEDEVRAFRSPAESIYRALQRPTTRQKTFRSMKTRFAI